MGNSTTTGGEQEQAPEGPEATKGNEREHWLRNRVTRIIDSDAWLVHRTKRLPNGEPLPTIHAWEERWGIADQKAAQITEELLRFQRKPDKYTETIRRIEINFPELVHVSEKNFRRLALAVEEIANEYTLMYSGRVMWMFGCGVKITYMPMTKQEEDAGAQMEYDESTLEITCAEREDDEHPTQEDRGHEGNH